MPGYRRARRDLAALLGDPEAGPPVIGVEHEYSVTRLADDRQLDFAHLVHGLGLGRRHLDPDDPNAYRLPSGAVVTADKSEAEIALPPVPVGAEFARHVSEQADAERSALSSRLPGLALTGYSTHISVEVPEGLEVPAGRLYVNRFGPAMLLAMDGADAPGLRIRPRNRRLELCGDFLDGPRLEQALRLAAGSVHACVAALTREPSAAPLPPAIQCSWLPAIERRGWFIGRAQLGLSGRTGLAGTFTLLDGRRLDVAEHVQRATAIAGRALEGLRGTASAVTAVDPTMTGAHGDVLRPRRRARYELAPVLVTWPLTVFVAASPKRDRTAFVSVPRPWLRAFLARLDDGRLDRVIAASLDGSGVRRRRDTSAAGSWEDVRRPAIFTTLTSRLALLPSEPI